MIRTFLFFIAGIIFTVQAYCQISSGGQPITFNKKDLPKEIPVVELNKINVEALLKEDASDSKAEGIPYRFGIDISTGYNLTNSGSWYVLSNGDRIWRLSIKSEGAFSLNFIMKNFYLPAGAQLFLFNKAGRVLGAFTKLNNTPEREFSTSPLSGDKVTFELFEPQNVIGQSSFEISYVIHAYRNLFGIAKDYGESGSCNINVNCPQGAHWQNEKRAVAMILTSNNTRICSGALINNVRQDGTPYFLTANHCVSGSNSNTWIFMFNYESPGCTIVNGPTNQTVQGSVLRAKDTPSDFALLELTTAPPAAYNVFFSGWNAVDIPSDSSVCINHPSGDIKKITFDFDTTVSYGYSGPGNDHWRITSWNAGTTEAGSSGSPLFNKSHKIIGQLHGGLASCTNTTGYDAFGKFAYSWNTGTTPDKRLKDWLDPDNTGALSLTGIDFNTPLYSSDAALVKIDTPTTSDICLLGIFPKITIRNYGSNILTSLTINYQLNSAPVQTTSWTGNLNYLGFSDITLPNIQVSNGPQTLKIFVTNPDGIADQNNSNDTLSINFNVIIANPVSLNLTTDNKPEETSWKLLDSTGSILYLNTPLTAQTSTTDIFCLSNGCYDFVILDSSGDGLAGGMGAPPGTYAITFLGDTLDSGGGNFGFSDTLHFCVNSAGVINPEYENNISIYPNPASDFINIVINNFTKNLFFELYTVNGQLIKHLELTKVQNIINVSTLKQGIYFIKVTDGNKQWRKRIVII